MKKVLLLIIGLFLICSKVKAEELNVEEVLYMNIQKNKYAYIIRDGARGTYLYKDEKSLYTKLYKGIKMIKLDP